MHDDKTAGPAVLGPVFLQLWLGEWVVLFGSALLGFALGVWAYQQTGSAQLFALVIVSGSVPALLLMPFAGALADRWPRRWIIAGCDTVFLLIGITLLLLHWRWGLQVAHLYVLNVVGAVVMALRLPASRAVLATVVAPLLLARANGLQGLSLTASQLVAPLLAGLLMARGGLGMVLALVLVLGLAGALLVFRALTQARLPPVQDAGTAATPVWQALLAQLRTAARWFTQQVDMGRLLAYTSIQKGLLTLVASMMTPLVLSTHSASVLGVVMTAAAAGGLLGSLALALLNLRRHLVTWVLLLDAFLSLCVVAVGLSLSPLWWGLGAFLAAFAGSMSEACAGTVWMRQAPPAQRASVLSLVSMSGMLTVSLVLLVGGAFSEQVLEPAMAAQGAWAATLGPWLGTGPGRGIGLLFVGCGSACCVISVLAFLGAGMRREPAASVA